MDYVYMDYCCIIYKDNSEYLCWKLRGVAQREANSGIGIIFTKSSTRCRSAIDRRKMSINESEVRSSYSLVNDPTTTIASKAVLRRNATYLLFIFRASAGLLSLTIVSSRSAVECVNRPGRFSSQNLSCYADRLSVGNGCFWQKIFVAIDSHDYSRVNQSPLVDALERWFFHAANNSYFFRKTRHVLSSMIHSPSGSVNL